MNERGRKTLARICPDRDERSGYRNRADRRVRALLAWGLAWLLAWPIASFAQTILGAEYDPATDDIVVQIAYQGTHPDHRFRLDWEECRKDADGRNSAVARMVDQHGDDIARKDYEVTRRFGLSGLDCRPVEVTIRLGPVSNRTVSVPRRGRGS